MVNTTLGIVGFIDVATPMGIEPAGADFGQTLASGGCDSALRNDAANRSAHRAQQRGLFFDTYTSIPALITTLAAWISGR